METARPGDRRRRDRSLPGSQAAEEREWEVFADPVDEASAESMITSDPPARSGLRLGPAKKPRSKRA